MTPKWAILLEDPITGALRGFSTLQLYRVTHAGREVRVVVDPGKLDEELIERLSASIERRLVAEVPLGAFLSGGVDSSVVAAISRRRSSSRGPARPTPRAWRGGRARIASSSWTD